MYFRTASALVVTFAILGTGGPNASSQDKAPGAGNVPKQVGEDLGEQAVAILSGATRVEVFRLEKKFAPKATPKTIGADRLQFPIKATGKEKGEAFAADVRAVLFDAATREPSGASGFRGDVAFRLWKGKESVTVVVDFEGSQFLVVPRGAGGKEGKVAVGGFLSEARLFKQVKALAVAAFPDDKELKALEEVEVEGTDPLKPPVRK